MASISNVMDPCIKDFEKIKEHLPTLYNFSRHHSYETDFQICTSVNIPSKLCSIYKSFSDIEIFCLPRTCEDDKIKEIIGKSENSNVWILWNKIECRNVDNPAWFSFWMCLFFTFIAIFTTIGTIFTLRSSKKILPYSTKPARILLKISSVFSLSENLKTLFNTKSSLASIDCLNGLKALSMPLIVLRHAFQIVTSYQEAMKNQEHERLNINSLHLTGILPTDTFFLVSGILCAKFFIHRKNLFSRFFQNLFHRYMRLTPSGIVVMSVFILIKFLLMSTHPNYFIDPEIENCKNFWWTSVLHIQNYWNVSNMCFGSFWFATVSIQMFLVTPLIMLVLKYLNLFFGIVAMIPVLVYTQVPAYNEMIKHRPYMSTICGYYYYEAVTRSYPYLVGLFYFWISTKISQPENSKKLNPNPNHLIQKICSTLSFFGSKVAWIATAFIIVSPLILFYNNSLSHDDLNLHYLTVRLFWPFALGWIVHACRNGFGGYVNKILSAKIFFPLSNISLGIYLWNDHTNLYLTEWLLKTPAEYNRGDIMFIFILTYIVCAINAALLFLFIEVPFHRLSLGKF